MLSSFVGFTTSITVFCVDGNSQHKQWNEVLCDGCNSYSTLFLHRDWNIRSKLNSLHHFFSNMYSDQFIPYGWASEVKPDYYPLQISQQKIESDLSLLDRVDSISMIS